MNDWTCLYCGKPMNGRWNCGCPGSIKAARQAKWHMALILAFGLVYVMFLLGCNQGYARCPDCGTAYQLRGGLPGQHDLRKCRICGGGPLCHCSKEASGWDDSIPKDQWDWEDKPQMSGVLDYEPSRDFERAPLNDASEDVQFETLTIDAVETYQWPEVRP